MSELQKWNVDVVYKKLEISGFRMYARSKEDAEEIARMKFREAYTDICIIETVTAREKIDV